MKERRVYGPPGTGKTTYLSRQIERAADKFGGEKVLVASCTRTAAVGLVGRDLPVPERAVGTLHSHCYHALGRPKLADAGVKEFNEQYPAWRFDPRGGSAEAVLEAKNWPKRLLLLRRGWHKADWSCIVMLVDFDVRRWGVVV
ncbi:MAG: hypothetical protein ACLGSA_10125 [Acidobacteriota bacterium]